MAFAVRPELAGNYFEWEAEETVTVPPSTGGVVCIPQTSDWGPFNTTVLLTSYDEFRELFGESSTPLQRAVYGAFKGEGRPGRGGAGAVIVYRMGVASGGGAAAQAAKVLNNTGAAAALTLTALYKGTRANALRATVQASAEAGFKEILLLDGSLVVERYTVADGYSSSQADELVAEINRSSNWVSAVKGTTGVALANVSASAFTGGLDGDTLTGAEWLAAQDAFDSERWSLIAAPGMTDSGVRAAFIAWIEERNAIGRRSMAVIGGAAAESLSTANARSVAANSWEVVNLGVGSLTLEDLGVTVGTADFSPRVAGAIANRGETGDLIFARFADVSIAGAPLSSEEESALGAGTTVFTRDTNADAPVFIREGVTTYTDDSQSPIVNGVKTHPVSLYKRIKNVRIQHGIETELDEIVTAGGYFGDLPVNDRTRNLVIGLLKTLYQRREDAEIIQPGWTVDLDPSVVVSDDDDFIQYLHGFHPTRSLRQMFHVARIG